MYITNIFWSNFYKYKIDIMAKSLINVDKNIVTKSELWKNNVYIFEKYNFYNVLPSYDITYIYLDRYIWTVFLYITLIYDQ